VSLYDRARLDSARILTSAQGFTVPVSFLSPSKKTYSTRCFFVAPSLALDLTTGLQSVRPRVGITVSLYDAAGVLLFDPENPADTPGTWRFTFTDNAGRTATYTAYDPMPDRTFGLITTTGKLVTTKDAEPAPEGD
jgi:hypothetical protein